MDPKRQTMRRLDSDPNLVATASQKPTRPSMRGPRETLPQLQLQLKKVADRKSKRLPKDTDLAKAEASLIEQFQIAIDELTRKRIETINYFQKVHEGKILWMNVVQIVYHDYGMLYSNEKHRERAKNFFFLGLSMGVLLSLPDGQQFVRAVAQLIEEYRYHISNPAFKGIVSLTKSNKGVAQNMPSEEDAPVTSEIVFAGNTPQYKYLITTEMNIQVDYYEVMMCLCTTLKQAYEKFKHPNCVSLVLMDAVVKIDTRLMNLVFEFVVHDLSKISKLICKHMVTAFKPRRRVGQPESESSSEDDDPFVLGGPNSGQADADDDDDADDDADDDHEERDMEMAETASVTAGVEDSREPPEVLVARLQELQQALEVSRDTFHRLDDQCTTTARALQELSLRLSSQSKVAAMLEEQKNLHEAYQRDLADSGPDAIVRVRDNFAFLERRSREASAERDRLSAEVASLAEESRALNTQRNTQKPEMMVLMKKVDKVEMQLRRSKETYVNTAGND
eukprot:Opistho-2@85233